MQRESGKKEITSATAPTLCYVTNENMTVNLEDIYGITEWIVSLYKESIDFKKLFKKQSKEKNMKVSNGKVPAWMQAAEETMKSKLAEGTSESQSGEVKGAGETEIERVSIPTEVSVNPQRSEELQ
ncbi:MAG: hypothetical protein AAGJ35_10885, partial [Myxococcota bacterium]